MYITEKDRKDFELIAESQTGFYNTPKKLNRSTFNIPQNVIDKIENHEVTLEMINKLGKFFPVFIYKTCVTIHGNFDFDNMPRIAGYKSIHKNKNNSLEVNWIAIDNEKKNRILSECREYANYQNDSNSTKCRILNIEAIHNQEMFERTKARFLNIKSEIEKVNFLGSVSIFRFSYYGKPMMLLQVNLLAIPQDSVKPLIQACCQLDGATYQVKAFERKTRLEELERKQIQDRLDREKKNAEVAEITSKMESVIKDLKPFVCTQGKIGVKVTKTWQDAVVYQWVRITDNRPFKQFGYEFAYTLGYELPKEWKQAEKGKKLALFAPFKAYN